MLFCGSASASLVPPGFPTPIQNMTFSIDVQGPTIGQQDSFYDIPIAGSDILTPENPSVPPGPWPPGQVPPPPPPGVFILNPPGGGFPPPGLAIDNAPGLGASTGWGEVDALSYGRDPIDTPFPVAGKPRPHYVFSVDEFAIGLPGTAVRTEGALGNQEAAADTFITPPKPVLPFPPTAPGMNYAFTDGDGVAPSGAPGVGLIEPDPPTVSTLPDPGDNLDAVDFDTTLADRSGPVYISLDSAFADPLEVASAPPNYGTAAANGFVGGDVLVGTPAPDPGGPLAIYAAAASLGLDLNGGDTDDLDALKLWENGIPGYQVSDIPFDWLTGATDMLLFSVRRGSDVIGRLDSIFGQPIEEGDILTTPCPAGSTLPDGTICVGGPTPGIFTAAEWLGLATVRSGTAASWGIINPAYGTDSWADDLDALDQKIPVPGTLALLGLGLSGFAALRRRRRSV
jgi:hypothetical protein